MFKSLISNFRRRQFFNLLIFYAAYLWFGSFSRSVLAPHFFESGISLKQMMLGEPITYVSPVLILLIFKKINNRKWWAAAIIASFIALLLIIKINFIWQYLLFCFIGGTATALFYVPYNIAHFKLTPQHRSGFSSGIMFSVYPVIALIAPLLAGSLAQLSYVYIWMLSVVFFLISLVLTKWQAPILFALNLKRDFNYLRPTRLAVLMQGIWETIMFGIIPIYTLYFIITPLGYGTFLSYLALVGILANLLLGRLSDVKQNRLQFLVPITVILGLSSFLFPWALKSLTLWLIINGFVQFMMPLFWNFSTAWFVDLQPDHARAMPVRELILNIGRVIGLFLAWINFNFQSPPTLIFYFLGGAMLIYPLVLVYNTRHAARF